jgi:hypothetical protein
MERVDVNAAGCGWEVNNDLRSLSLMLLHWIISEISCLFRLDFVVVFLSSGKIQL